MSIQHIIASINHLHGDDRNRVRQFEQYAAWRAARKPPAAPEPMPTVRTPRGHLAPDYSKPGVAEQVKKSVDEAYDAHHSIDKTRS